MCAFSGSREGLSGSWKRWLEEPQRGLDGLRMGVEVGFRGGVKVRFREGLRWKSRRRGLQGLEAG